METYLNADCDSKRLILYGLRRTGKTTLMQQAITDSLVFFTGSRQLYDPESVICEIYEIKHGNEAVSGQNRYLIDEKKCSDKAFRYGDIIRKSVIYRGNPRHLLDTI